MAMHKQCHYFRKMLGFVFWLQYHFWYFQTFLFCFEETNQWSSVALLEIYFNSNSCSLLSNKNKICLEGMISINSFYSFQHCNQQKHLKYFLALQFRINKNDYDEITELCACIRNNIAESWKCHIFHSQINYMQL